MKRVLILAQGAGTRWDFRDAPFLGKPKQLVVIDGETLTARAKRLFAERGCEVVVIASHPELFPDVTLDNPFPSGTEMDKFYSTQHLWLKDGRTIIAWGDCFYTEDAVTKIVSHESDDLMYFRRPTESATTGHKWDESFAVSFGPHEHKRVLDLADKVVNAVRMRKVKKEHIRTHYAASLGVAMDNRQVIINTPGQVVIDDWTDDFDRPDEWMRWVGRYYRQKINVAGCAGFRPGDKYRNDSFFFIHKHLSKEIPIFYGTHKGGKFNRSAARNAAVAQTDADVIFLFDTDVSITQDQLWAAAYLASITGHMVIAFDDFIKLDVRQTMMFMRGAQPKPIRAGIRNHASCALAVPRALWDRVGGYDERFDSWGGEDRALWLACNAVSGAEESHRIPGNAFHLWHPNDPGRDNKSPSYHKMVELCKRYKLVCGSREKTGIIEPMPTSRLDLDALFELMREEGGPLNYTPKGEILHLEGL